MAYKRNIIVGGGISGLFLHYLFKINNIDSFLIAKYMGGEQTLLSQGIIHGGLKYALNGFVTNESESIREMPGLWKSYLSSPFFDNVKLLSEIMALIPIGTISARVNSFLASTLTSSRSSRMTSQLYPTKSYHVLNENVYDPKSLIAAFMKLPDIFSGEVIRINENSTITLSDQTDIKFDNLFVMAGKGILNFSEQFDIRVQKRPLRMLQVYGKFPNYFCHVIGSSSKPLATITANSSGLYVGGEIAESGVSMDKSVFLDWATRKLTSYGFPVTNTASNYEVIDIDRIEGWDPQGKKPNGPIIIDRGNVFFGLPTKLTFAPSLAQKLLDRTR